MAKLIKIGVLTLIASIGLMISGFAVSGFNIHNLTNFGNYEKTILDLSSKDIKLINCEIVEIDDGIKSTLEYYTNDDLDYKITEDENFIYIEQLGEIEDLGFSYGKKIKVKINLSTKVSVHIEARDSIVQIEDVFLDELYINSNDCIVSVDSITANKLTCISVDDILRIEDNEINEINIDTKDSILTLELNKTRMEYTVSLEGNSKFNISSGGNGLYILSIKSYDTLVTIDFD